MAAETAVTSDDNRRQSHPYRQVVRKIRLVLNLTAANDERVRDAVSMLRDRGNHVDVRVAWDPADAVHFAEEAVSAKFDVVVAGGGDGTVNAVVAGLLSRQEDQERHHTALGILPFGTANDLANSCGLNDDNPAAVLAAIATEKPTLIDVGLMNEIPFLNVASGGYAAEVTTETDPELKKLLGGLAYWLTGITSLGHIEPRLIRLKADDFTWEGRVYAVAVCNGRQAGGGLRLAPRALLDDGLLDVAIVPEVPWTEFLDVYADLQRLEENSRSEHILYQQAKHIFVEAPDGLQVNLDGEPHRGKKFDFKVVPKRLPCMLPHRCPAIVHCDTAPAAAAE